MVARWLWCVLALLGCGDAPSAVLLIDLQTDLRPDVDFASVAVLLEAGGETRTVTIAVAPTDDWLSGDRLTEFDQLPNGDARLRVELLDLAETPVLVHEVDLPLDGATNAITVVMTRSCRDQDCAPMQCLGGRCVERTCSPQAPEGCGPVGECGSDTDCAGDCADHLCVLGACLSRLDDDACGAGELCADDGFCAPIGPPDAWGPPTKIEELSDPVHRDDDPTLSPDMLEIYFSGQRPGSMNSDIYRSTRGSLSDPWETPTRVVSLSTPEKDENPMLTHDGLTLYYLRGGFLHQTVRASPTEPWGTPELVDLSGVVFAGCPSPAATHLTLSVCARTGAGGDLDIFFSTRRTDADPWEAPMRVLELNSESADVTPYFGVPGERVIYLASERPGGPGLRDLYVANRPSSRDDFGAPTLIPGLSSELADENPWVSDDERTMVFASDRDGTFDLWMSVRP